MHDLTTLQLAWFSVETAAVPIFWLEANARFIYANKASCALLGYSLSELLQLTFHDIDPDFPLESWPAHWEKLSQRRHATIESQHRSKDGRLFPVEMNISHLDFEGREYLYVVMRDITERKQTEKALRDSERLFRLTLDATSDGFWDRNLVTGEIHYGKNWALNLGYSDAEMQEQQITWESLLHPQDKAAATAAVDDHLKGRTSRYLAEFRLRHKTGDWKWILAKGKVMEWDEQETPLRFVGTHTDISERKQAEEALRQSSEHIKMFAYSVAHDLKNPAIAVYALTRSLQEKFGDILSDKGKSFCAQIMNSSEQLVALVDKINIFISAKETPLFIEEVSLDEILRIIREEFATQLSIRDITWNVTAEMPVIRCDRIAILRVLRNLVDNSLKYGGERLGEIAVEHRETEDFHIISVRDDGVGIKQEESGGIFRAFERRKSSRGIQGTGLGLAIVKEIASQHHGEIWTTPSLLQQGITFNISIFKRL